MPGVRLLPCASARALMGKLLAGQAPLRGRAGLELYRKEFVREDTPRSRSDFADWICRTALNPSMPIFREAATAGFRARNKGYGALRLRAVGRGRGNGKRSGIANITERRSGELGHPLNVLAASGPAQAEQEHVPHPGAAAALPPRLVRPSWSELERSLLHDHIRAVWDRGRDRFVGSVVGRHFEQLCRHWAARFAGPETFGGQPQDGPLEGGSAVANDARQRRAREVDVLVTAPGRAEARVVLSIGEAKWGQGDRPAPP